MKEIIFYKISLKLKLIVAATCLFSSSAFAGTCANLHLKESKVAYSNIVIQRDAPVGTVLFEGSTQSVSDYADNCDDEVQLRFTMTYAGTVKSSYGEHMYETNIEGLSIIFATKGTAQTYFDNPPNYIDFNVWDGHVLNWDGGDIKYIKTGPIQSGVLNGGVLGELAIKGSDGVYHTAVNFTMDTATITSLACSITTPKMTFPMGTIQAGQFNTSVGTISTETNTQNLGLNCEAGTNINVMLSGEQDPDVSEKSVLALTGKGQPDVASGLGVQLIYDGKPMEINKRILMKVSEDGLNLLPITARYYQTKSAVTVGEASTSATLALTYQ